MSSSGFEARARAVGCWENWPHGGDVIETAVVAWAYPQQLRFELLDRFCLHALSPDGVDHPFCTLPRPPWWDHVSHWWRGDTPTVLVAQPYDLDDDAEADLRETARDLRLDLVLASDGWYGTSYFIQLWRGGARYPSS